MTGADDVEAAPGITLEAIRKAKRRLEQQRAEPDDLIYFAKNAEIGNWEFMCWLKLNRVKVVKLQPLPLWKVTVRPRRRR